MISANAGVEGIGKPEPTSLMRTGQPFHLILKLDFGRNFNDSNDRRL